MDIQVWHNAIDVYQEEIGIQYPFVGLYELKKHIDRGRVEDAKDSPRAMYGGTANRERTTQLDDIAALVLVIAAAFKDSAASKIAKELVETTFTSIIVRTQLYPVDLDRSMVLILTVSILLVSLEPFNLPV